MMKTILILGAGRSSSHLIRYLLQHAVEEQWMIRIGDMDVEGARSRFGSNDRLEMVELDAYNDEQRRMAIATSDLVISMLPAAMHLEVVQDCITLRRHAITPSYVPDTMWSLHEDARRAGVLLLNEMGVDPGIDHMSAMRIIDRIRSEGGEIREFESYTGGLVAPESDTNPWHYKVTWNPRNVVLAGSGGAAAYRKDGELKFIPYSQLFTRVTGIDVPGYGLFEGYANRDSLKYTEVYGLQQVDTLLRGTLRKDGFCASWNALVQIGLTDDQLQLPDADKMTWRGLLSAFSSEPTHADPAAAFARQFGWNEQVISNLKWLGIFEDRPLGIKRGTPAQALQKLIEERWKLGADDRDLLVMWHGFHFVNNGSRHFLRSWLTAEGEDPVFTAMSKTVGLPIGIAARQILRGNWNLSGVVLPTIPVIYNPVLDELEKFGIIFRESEVNQ